MIIKSVDITNYRLFFGDNHFDFSSNQNKSLNIIFGKNSFNNLYAYPFEICLFGIII